MRNTHLSVCLTQSGQGRRQRQRQRQRRKAERPERVRRELERDETLSRGPVQYGHDDHDDVIICSVADEE